MRRRTDTVGDPFMKKLVELVQEDLPNSAQQARIHLLKRLGELECEALRTGADPETLLLIRSTQQLIVSSDPLMSVTPFETYGDVGGALLQ